MIDEIFTSFADSITSDGNVSKNNGALSLEDKKYESQDYQTLIKSLDRIEKNLSYQNHLLYIDTILLTIVLFFSLIYRFFKIFI